MKPSYYDEFKCLADKCPFTCCMEWDISVDEATKNAWEADGLSACMTKKNGAQVVAFDSTMHCPLIDEHGLCTRVIAKGEESIPMTCRRYPREWMEVSGEVEYHLLNTCPAVLDTLYQMRGKALELTKSKDLLQQVRNLFIKIMEMPANSPDIALLMIFYIAEELLAAEEEDALDWALVEAYEERSYLRELRKAVEDNDHDPVESAVERMELFLDLTNSYLEEGHYSTFLQEMTKLASKGLKESESKSFLMSLRSFNTEMEAYYPFLRRLLQTELYNELLVKNGSFSDLYIKLEWVLMRFAVIWQCCHLRWCKNHKISYEDIKECMIVIGRCTCNEEDVIIDYFEESFESSFWDLGYAVLLLGR